MEGWGWQSVHDPEMLTKVLEQWKLRLLRGRCLIWSFLCVALMVFYVRTMHIPVSGSHFYSPNNSPIPPKIRKNPNIHGKIRIPIGS
jgi:hypothetical protein